MYKHAYIRIYRFYVLIWFYIYYICLYCVNTVCLTHVYTCICAYPNKQLRENSKIPIIPPLTNSLQQKHRLL